MNTRFTRRATHWILCLAALFACTQIDTGAFGTFRIYDDDKDPFYDGQKQLRGYFYNHLRHQGIHLDGPSRNRFPEILVTEYPQEIYSGERALRLSNHHDNQGWLLGGKNVWNRLLEPHSS